MHKITLKDEFEFFWKKIEKSENFSLLRYGDGERAIMVGETVTAQEGWISPNYVSQLGKDLLESLNVDDPRLHYGISDPDSDRAAYYWYSSRIASKHRTFANLWVNSNYQTFVTNFAALKRDAVVIANHRACGKPIGNLNILKYYSVGDDCIRFWEEDAPQLVEQIKADFGDKSDLLFVVSAGPMSEPIIVDLFKNNPNNCYIDFGSSIDMFIHERQTRPYMNPDNKYARSQGWMHAPKDFDLDVTVVLNLFKRPDNLEKQIEAIQNQTLKPKEILIFQDAVPSGKIPFPDHLREHCHLVEISPENVGVWGRFHFANKAQSSFVCVFDDDTIPGKRWLENCHAHMDLQEGLYGSNGILMYEPAAYPKKMLSLGWKTQNKHAIEVDFVGHSWFFKKEWLQDLYQAPQSVQDLKICGEDMSFSYMLLKNRNIKTYVPPHPVKDKNYALYGSIPKYGMELGADETSLSVSQDNLAKYNKAMNILLDDGWKSVLERSSKQKYLVQIIRIVSSLIPFKKIMKSVRNILVHKVMRVGS